MEKISGCWLKVSDGFVGRDVIPPIYGYAGCHPAPHQLFVWQKKNKVSPFHHDN
jgi:hypothetical protein